MLLGEESPFRSLRAEDYFLLAAVCLLPWAFGGVEIWAFRSASFLIAAAVFLALARRGWGGMFPLHDNRWLIVPALLAGWGLFQCLPLPPPVIRFLSPKADHIFLDSVPGYGKDRALDPQTVLEERALQRLGDLVDPPSAGEEIVGMDSHDRRTGIRVWRPLSLYPWGTFERVAWFASLLMAFVLARRRMDSVDRYRVYRTVLLVTITLVAGSGVLQFVYDNGKLLWVRSMSMDLRSIGPYVNPNHFAGLMELAVPWLFGYAWLRYRTAGRDVFKESRGPLALAAGMFCMAAGVMAASKMAVVLLSCGVLALFMVCLRTRTGRLIALAGFLLLACGMLLGLRHVELGRRIMDFINASGGNLGTYGRLVAWKSALPMLVDYPLTGIGFGAFGQVFAYYVAAGEPSRWLQLHNDYVEVIIEGGVVAALLLAALIWAYWTRAWRMTFGARSHGTMNPERIGLLIGLASLSLHGFVDFNHQIPGNALMFVVVAALALHQDPSMDPRSGSKESRS